MLGLRIRAAQKDDGTVDFGVDLAGETTRDQALQLMAQAALLLLSQPPKPVLVPATPADVAVVRGPILRAG